ncbi:hypothetical protein KSP40_PGU018361 [Platanthera guangdongensis]|uniref:Uncharacterized protein n=1 Tax=Platanthera guangdongensis TaxID=2320717 RepID=A0ABR2MTR5_9ASPA
MESSSFSLEQDRESEDLGVCSWGREEQGKCPRRPTKGSPRSLMEEEDRRFQEFLHTTVDTPESWLARIYV